METVLQNCFLWQEFAKYLVFTSGDGTNSANIKVDPLSDISNSGSPDPSGDAS